MNKVVADTRIILSQAIQYPVYQVVRVSDGSVLFQSLEKKKAVEFCKQRNLTFVLDEV
jgi:hypothetical protein